ncbi:MAG: FixH family protein, partial [Duncaniella sp.]|nr:FixH family protein [Duncaniella sp.]
MKIFKLKFLAVMLICMVSVLPVMADKMTQPDFAFPVKVMESSEKSLSKALKNRDNQLVVQSLIELCIAENSIDKNNVGRMIAKIDSVKRLSAEPTLLSMLNALEARMLTDVYKDNKYVYDRRVIPADSYSEDIFLWSGEQFRNKIMNLVDASLENESALKKCPIGKYSLNISVADEDKVFYPLLYDFIAYQAIRTLNSISSDPGFVGRLYLVSGPMFVASLYSSPKINASTEYAKKILELYSSLLTLHADDVPAYINADLARLDYVKQHIYADENDKMDYAKVLTEMYNRYRESEYSCAILIALLQTELTYDTSNHPRLLKLIDGSIADYPQSPFADRLKRIREFITQKSLEIMTPRNVYPGEKCSFSVTLNNVRHAEIKIYDISNHSEELTADSLQNLVPIAILSADALSDIPFSDKRELSFVFPGFGKFWVVPSFKDDKVETGTPAHVYVTSLAAVAREAAGDRSILVLDRVSGEPVKDAVVSFKRYMQHNFHEYVEIGITDSNGLFSLPSTSEGGSCI